jgi:hypothetical protein
MPKHFEMSFSDKLDLARSNGWKEVDRKQGFRRGLPASKGRPWQSFTFEYEVDAGTCRLHLSDQFSAAGQMSYVHPDERTHYPFTAHSDEVVVWVLTQRPRTLWGDSKTEGYRGRQRVPPLYGT